MQESNTQPITDETEAIAALLSPSAEPEKAEATPEPEKEQAGADPAAEPEKDEPAAEVEPEKAIDYGMKIPITGAEPVTLGELKDLWQNQAQAKLDLIEERNEFVRTKVQSEILINFMESLPPQMIQLAQQRAAESYQKQMQNLADRVPEVKQQAGLDALRQDLVSLAKEYAAPPEEVGSVQFAWAIHMMRDLARYKQAIKDAKATVRPIRSETPRAAQAVPQQTNPIQKAIDRAKQSRNSSDEAAAVDAILRSKSA